MVRHTKPLSGGGKDKFLRGLVDGVESLSEVASRALKRELTASIMEVRVRREAYDRVRDQGGQSANKPVEPVPPEPSLPPSPAAPSQSDAVVPSFDPFAFSVVAVLTKKGKPALQAALEKIEAVDDLKRLATAQHLAIDPSHTTAADIRTAIVAGAERRIAERKAAAS